MIKINKKHLGKSLLRFVIVLTIAVLICSIITLIIHKSKSSSELELLKEKGYYNPVSVGDYCLNVSVFGNNDGKHRIIGMAGLGSGDFSVSMRKASYVLEEDNLVAFVDRAGYGLSDDCSEPMTLEYIVEDYRRAVQNAGIQAPYVLMAHSIGGAYATWWCSKYPEEIEAVILVDGSELSAEAFADYEPSTVGFGTRLYAFLAKIGFSRLALRNYFYSYPDNYNEEEQTLGDALELKTLDSIAPVSEDSLIVANSRQAFNEIVTNDIPKLYICASIGIDSQETLEEYHRWINVQLKNNHINSTTYVEEYLEENTEDYQELVNSLEVYRRYREEILYPYLEKLGSCECVLLGGDHMIYEQKSEECGSILKAFVDKLN